jgi:hypothetical protein
MQNDAPSKKRARFPNRHQAKSWERKHMRTLVKLISAIGLWAFALTPMTATAQEITDIQSNGNLHLRGYGSGFITGETHLIDADTARGGVTSGGTVAGGYSMYNQMYVAFMLPQAQNGKKA